MRTFTTLFILMFSHSLFAIEHLEPGEYLVEGGTNLNVCSPAIVSLNANNGILEIGSRYIFKITPGTSTFEPTDHRGCRETVYITQATHADQTIVTIRKNIRCTRLRQFNRDINIILTIKEKFIQLDQSDTDGKFNCKWRWVSPARNINNIKKSTLKKLKKK